MSGDANSASWDAQGQAFSIKNIKSFTKLLPQYFKTSNYSSFVRQLNIYAFHKSKSDNCDKFRHPLFRRGRVGDLKLIKRNLRKTNKPPSNSSYASEVEYDYRDLSKQLKSYKVNIEVLESQVEMLKIQNSILVNNLEVSKALPKRSTVSKMMSLLCYLVKSSENELTEEIRHNIEVLERAFLQDSGKLSDRDDKTVYSDVIKFDRTRKLIYEEQLEFILALVIKQQEISKADQFLNDKNHKFSQQGPRLFPEHTNNIKTEAFNVSEDNQYEITEKQVQIGRNCEIDVPKQTSHKDNNSILCNSQFADNLIYFNDRVMSDFDKDFLPLEADRFWF